jgi:hypothetical protein
MDAWTACAPGYPSERAGVGPQDGLRAAACTLITLAASGVIVHELGGARQNILNHFMRIKFCSVIDAIPLMDSPAILILGTIACDHEPVSPSNFCGATGEATATKPA